MAKDLWDKLAEPAPTYYEELVMASFKKISIAMEKRLFATTDTTGPR